MLLNCIFIFEFLGINLVTSLALGEYLVMQRRGKKMYLNEYGIPFSYYPAYNSQRAFEPKDVQNSCTKFMNYYVTAHLNDGSKVEGIIVDMEDDAVTMLVPEELDEDAIESNRQFGGYGGYGGYRRRFRRFRRHRFPFSAFIFPFILPYPFYSPYPYPYY